MPSTPHDLCSFFSQNNKWTADVLQENADFFNKSAIKQYPRILWIGCSDSRVPESVITACAPGEIFVHRNIANQFHPDDISAQSVLTYAVEHLHIKHIVVVGHTGCGGVEGAYSAACAEHASGQGKKVSPSAPLAKWLAPLSKHVLKQEDFKAETPSAKTLTKLSKESVGIQVKNIAETEVMKNAWKANKSVSVHGWIYNLETGRLTDLDVSIGSEEAFDSDCD